MAIMARSNESPEEHGAGRAPRRGGGEGREEGGFREGTHGRGPTPFELRKHSKKPNGHSLEAHSATSGRGGGGRIGKGDGFKGRSEDLEHPLSHAEFESLGTADE